MGVSILIMLLFGAFLFSDWFVNWLMAKVLMMSLLRCVGVSLSGLCCGRVCVCAGEGACCCCENGCGLVCEEKKI